ncbi:MAG TPA: hypothetical protein VLI39_16890 [Sedimentisphaerales bacterium]|nr:hypothetical protein [Sedimentisphaerales bacterium]
MKAKKGDLREDPRTRRDYALTKKGVGNMSVPELQEWIRICEKMEGWVRAAKGRRNWKDARVEAEHRLELQRANDTAEE